MKHMVRAWCLFFSGCLLAGAAMAAGEAETALRLKMQAAVWPSVLKEQARLYLQAYPAGDWADAARSVHERAERMEDIVSRRDVGLYRGAVEQLARYEPLAADVRSAMLGDSRAAMQIALSLKDAQPQRYIGWLQLASALGDKRAAYQLALHFRTQDQPAMAARYEAQAVALGFVPPTVLDHVRSK